MKTSAQQSVFDFYFSFPFSAYVQIYFSFFFYFSSSDVSHGLEHTTEEYYH